MNFFPLESIISVLLIFQLKDFEGKETAQLVDRYKFLDLFPCTTTELKSIGYSPVSSEDLNFERNYIVHTFRIRTF